LGIFDRLEKAKAKSAETLAAELGVDPTLLYRLLRAESAIGLLEEDDAGGFVLIELGARQPVIEQLWNRFRFRGRRKWWNSPAPQR
jgi:hypothetical protein